MGFQARQGFGALKTAIQAANLEFKSQGSTEVSSISASAPEKSLTTLRAGSENTRTPEALCDSLSNMLDSWQRLGIADRTQHRVPGLAS